MTIEILLYEGFDELDAFGPYEVLHGAGLPIRYVTLDGAERVTASHGTVVVTGMTLGRAPDVLLVPGGGWRARSPVGAWAEYERGVIPAAIAARHAAGSTVASVCTGAMLLAQAGILDGRPAVTHHVALEDLRSHGVDVRADARVVDDGDVLTAAGVTSGLDLALHLLARFSGAEVADRAARALEYVPPGRVLTRA